MDEPPKVAQNFTNALEISSYEQGDLTSAIHSYQLAVAGNPQHADAWCNLGNAYSSIWQTRSQEQGILQQAVNTSIGLHLVFARDSLA